jgi:hypothetical protein
MNQQSYSRIPWIRLPLATSVAVLLFFGSAAARDQKADGPLQDGDSNAELKTVEKALISVFDRLDPKVKVEYRGNSLIATYLPQSFKIHGRNKSGEIDAEAHEEIGPSFKGFVLKVHLQPKGTVNQAITPQTIQTPYWPTDLDVTTIASTDKQIYWGLSYGSRTEKELLDKIRAKLKNLGESTNRRP